jgi:predicted esterase
MPEMRWLALSLFLAGSCPAVEAQEPSKLPSPLVIGGEFLSNARMQDVEALSAAIRLEVDGDPKVAQRDERIPILIRATEQALRMNANNVGWVLGARLLALLRGVPYGPATDLAISLDFRLDRGVISPGGFLHARLNRVLRVKEPPGAKLQFAIADSTGMTVWQGESMDVPAEDPIDVPLPVRALPVGSYKVIYRLLAGGQEPVVTGARPFLVDSGWRRKQSELSQAAHSIALKGLPAGDARAPAAFQFIEWVIRGMAAEAAGEPAGGMSEPHPVIESWASGKSPKFWSATLSSADIERAQSYARHLQSGADPLAGQEDLRLAYDSNADQSIRTFRLFLPSTLPPDEPVPLIVVLHGFGGDESSWLDTLPGSGEVLRRMARERRFAVLAPSARSRYSRFEGPDQADLERLRQLVSRIRRIDPARTALIGHGPAAFTAINIALASPQNWSSAVAIAGLPTGLPTVKPGHTPRLLFEFAADDKLFAASEARKWAYLLQKRIPGFESSELPGVDNTRAPAASLERAVSFILESPARPAAK